MHTRGERHRPGRPAAPIATQIGDRIAGPDPAPRHRRSGPSGMRPHPRSARTRRHAWNMKKGPTEVGPSQVQLRRISAQPHRCNGKSFQYPPNVIILLIIYFCGSAIQLFLYLIIMLDSSDFASRDGLHPTNVHIFAILCAAPPNATRKRAILSIPDAHMFIRTSLPACRDYVRGTSRRHAPHPGHPP